MREGLTELLLAFGDEQKLALFYEFVWFCRERHNIYERRERGEPPPWTDDPILQRYKINNVFRDLDRGSIWLKDNLVYEDEIDRLGRVVFFRLWNNWRQIEQLGGIPPVREWDNVEAMMTEKGLKLYNPAYRSLPGRWMARVGGARKFQMGLLEIRRDLPQVWESISREVEHFQRGELDDVRALARISRTLTKLRFVGPFISMQVWRDLIMVGALPFWPPRWAEVGPGASSALVRLGLPGTEVSSIEKVARLLPVGYTLFTLEEPEYRGYRLSQILPDVEHALCEWNKYRKVKEGTGVGRYYRYEEG